jgi:hypothetical protein
VQAWEQVAAAACAAAFNVLAAAKGAGEGVGADVAAACLQAAQQLQEAAPGVEEVACRLQGALLHWV